MVSITKLNGGCMNTKVGDIFSLCVAIDYNTKYKTVFEYNGQANNLMVVIMRVDDRGYQKQDSWYTTMDDAKELATIKSGLQGYLNDK